MTFYVGDWRSGTDNRIEISDVELLNDDGTTTIAAPALLTVFVQLQNPAGQVLLNPPLQALPVAEQNPLQLPTPAWVAHVPAAAVVFGSSWWRLIVLYHGPQGLTDALYGTESTIVIDGNR